MNKERYILMVSPNSDGDNDLKSAKSTDFTIKDQRALFKEKPINWSYILLKLSKAPKIDIKRRAIGSESPWATVIRTQLNVIPASRSKDESQLTSVADNAFTALSNLEKFLLADRSFSSFDKAESLYYYADTSIKTIEKVCKNKKYQQCPIDQLDQYRSRIAEIFNVGQADVKLAANAMQLKDIVDVAVASGGKSEYLDQVIIKAGKPFNPSKAEWEEFLGSYATGGNPVAYESLEKEQVNKAYQDFFNNEKQ